MSLTALLESLDRNPPSEDVASLAELMNTYAVPGVSIASFAGGSPWSAAYGTVSTASVFQACSISKHVTAFAVMRLVDDGALDLDADVNDYLVSWHAPGARTLRQLLDHTAGLSAGWYRGYRRGDPYPSVAQTLLGEAPANTPPVRGVLPAGSEFRYAGSHYAVIQQVLEDVAGPFDRLMSRLVLLPLGMADSSFALSFPARVADRIAPGHHVTGTPVPGGWRVLPEQAEAGLWSTPLDLIKLETEILAALRGESVLLSRQTAAQMLESRLPGDYGLGTWLGRSPTRFGHTGKNVGYTCFSFAWPEANAALAVMTNSDDGGELLASILAAADRHYTV